MRQAQQRTARDPGANPRLPSRYHLITPTDWYRIPLRSTDDRARSVRALVDRTCPSRDEHAARRRELQELLSAMADSAAHRNGLELYLSTQTVLGFPVPCSLLVTVEPEGPGQPVRLPGDMVADGLRDKYGDGARVSTVTLPSGPAVRCRRQETTEDTRDLGQPADRPNTVLDLYLPVPDSDAWMVLTFSTPMPELADAQVELFDAIAATLRWS